MLEALQTVFHTNLPLINLQLADLIDIAILSVLIYKMLWMMRKTSSGRVLRGILVLLGAMMLSSAIPLTTTSYLLSKAVEWGVLGVFILFQPEIRRYTRKRDRAW